MNAEGWWHTTALGPLNFCPQAHNRSLWVLTGFIMDLAETRVQLRSIMVCLRSLIAVPTLCPSPDTHQGDGLLPKSLPLWTSTATTLRLHIVTSSWLSSIALSKAAKLTMLSPHACTLCAGLSVHTVSEQQRATVSSHTEDLLLDFADVLQVNVFTLGSTYLKLCRKLNVSLPIIGITGRCCSTSVTEMNRPISLHLSVCAQA